MVHEAIMLNYKFISINLDIIVSATIGYVFIRIHVESFNVVYEPCHGETRLCQYVAWMSRVYRSGWRMRSVRLSPRTENKVFPRPGPYFSVYAVIVYKCLYVNCRH